MPKYRFVVQAPSGKVRRGTLTESDEYAARKRLESAGFSVVSLGEEADIVVHTPTSGSAASQARMKPERADIIEFEETLGEKIQNFLTGYVLRRETAMVLGMLGFVWIIYSSWGVKKPTPAVTPDFHPLKVVVTVDVSKAEGNTLDVRLPDIPFRSTAPLKADSDGTQKMVIERETTVVPSKVEVYISDGEDPVAKDAGELVKKSEGNYEFAASPTPLPKE